MSHDGAAGSELDILRHSTAHVMAKAVQRLYPGAKLAIGPTIEHGFYYDIDIPQTVSVEDLPKIEAEMRRIIDADEPFVRSEIPREEALAFFREKGEPYKVEIVEGVEDPTVSLYATGDDWIDLCRGPHIGRSSQIKAFKLTSVAGAYWRGDENRPMLQRIYGTAWPSQEQLDHYLWQVDEARRRDHRRLGREVEDEEYAFKPMNCPESTLVYRFSTRSYRDLPLRLAQTDRLLRNERSGTLNGLLRVRQLTMDDAHIFCREDQIQDEIRGVLEFQRAIYSVFGLEPVYYLSTRPEKAIGDPAVWDRAETDLKAALEANGLAYQVKE